MRCTEACVTTEHVKWDDNYAEKKETVFQKGLHFYNIVDKSQRNHAHSFRANTFVWVLFFLSSSLSYSGILVSTTESAGIETLMKKINSWITIYWYEALLQASLYFIVFAFSRKAFFFEVENSPFLTQRGQTTSPINGSDGRETMRLPITFVCQQILPIWHRYPQCTAVNARKASLLHRFLLLLLLSPWYSLASREAALPAPTAYQFQWREGYLLNHEKEKWNFYIGKHFLFATQTFGFAAKVFELWSFFLH